METTTLPKFEVLDFNTFLQDLRAKKEQLQVAVETYMQSDQSGLDGSLHPALNTNDSRIGLDPNRHKWVEAKIEEVSR